MHLKTLAFMMILTSVYHPQAQAASPAESDCSLIKDELVNGKPERPKEQFRCVIASHANEIDGIFQEYSRRNPVFESTIKIKLVVLPNGNFKTPPTIEESSILDSGFQQSVLKIFFALKFPPSNGATQEAVFPINFYPH